MASITSEQSALQSPSDEAARLDIPERPALAPDVELVGMMQGAAFTEQQWLIQRGTQFIQVTELLYKVAEQIDGTRTLEEIAEAVTEASDWYVTAENIEQIIERKLIPLGIIAAEDGTSALSRSTTVADLMQAALAINMRMKVIGPKYLEPITNVLKVFFAPPILISMLVVIAIAHVWLYAQQFDAIITGVLDVLYTPGLMLAVLAIVLVSSFFHEFGHGSALRYGGGHVRGMGFGIYLIYPAFYTDVTDGYRLGRWARVRTDLGGVYFHFIFTLALIGLFVATGQHFLLLAVVVINSDVLRQFIPFVRLDGYWLLADLTGIPDFFSQIMPFARSVLPIPGLKGDKLPDVKPWVKVIFLLFIALTIPALVVLFFVMAFSLPTLLKTTWDSLSSQLEIIAQAQSIGNIVGMVLPALQILLLALPVVGTFLILYIMGRAGARALWDWSRSSMGRRIAGSLVAVGVLALMALVWIPQLVSAGEAGPPGVESYEVIERNHVDTPVTYAQNPPVGGDHATQVQNCGFYDQPIRNENAVHSMEHGAVWITYKPDLANGDKDSIQRLVQSRSHLLASPKADLPAPVVLSSWGQQLRLNSVDDPRLERFVQRFRLSDDAPENGGECTGGVGTPK